MIYCPLTFLPVHPGSLVIFYIKGFGWCGIILNGNDILFKSSPFQKIRTGIGKKSKLAHAWMA
jgi:hypothetical protein